MPPDYKRTVDKNKEFMQGVSERSVIESAGESEGGRGEMGGETGLGKEVQFWGPVSLAAGRHPRSNPARGWPERSTVSKQRFGRDVASS